MAILLTTCSESFSVACRTGARHAAARHRHRQRAATGRPGRALGDLGAGKTTFPRALIRYLAGDETTEVPSPTFTLMQAYDLPQFPLVHVDLYRISGSAELAELGSTTCPRARSCCSNGPTGPRASCRPTGSTWR